MVRDRKEYRKNLNAHGSLHIGGETLRLNCYDISVKGAMVEVIPGELLCDFEDFQTLLKDDQSAELFIEDLMMTGEVIVAWVKQDRGRIMMGLEFHQVLTNCKKLWRKRQGYRKKKTFSVELIIDKDRIPAKGVNYSMMGLCLTITENHPAIKPNALVKIHGADDFSLEAIGKVAWIRPHDEFVELGLQTILYPLNWIPKLRCNRSIQAELVTEIPGLYSTQPSGTLVIYVVRFLQGSIS